MKQLYSYWGGKQTMIEHIKKQLPKLEGKIIIEPFAGGGGLFWSNTANVPYIINDIDERLINFYAMVKTNQTELFRLMEASCHSRVLHKKAQDIVKEGKIENDPVLSAWAWWYSHEASILNQWNNQFLIRGFDRNGKIPAPYGVVSKQSYLIDPVVFNKKFVRTTIECMDAIELIKRYDKENSFIYADPPYIDTHQGSYMGKYTCNDYQTLLETLSTIKGQFLLSSYPNDILAEAVTKYDWHVVEIESRKPSSALSKSENTRRVELLVRNYTLPTAGFVY